MKLEPRRGLAQAEARRRRREGVALAVGQVVGPAADQVEGPEADQAEDPEEWAGFLAAAEGAVVADGAAAGGSFANK